MAAEVSLTPTCVEGAAVMREQSRLIQARWREGLNALERAHPGLDVLSFDVPPAVARQVRSLHEAWREGLTAFYGAMVAQEAAWIAHLFGPDPPPVHAIPWRTP